MNANNILNEILAGQSVDIDGNPIPVRVRSAVTAQEAAFLQQTVIKYKPQDCLEVGAAFGASTVAICSGLEKNGSGAHTAIDPRQTFEYKGAAVAAVKRCGLEHMFTMIEKSSQVALPALWEQGREFDFIFVDGNHTFDAVLVDAYFADKMLKPGGILILHDMGMPAIRRVSRWLMTHRRYARLPGIPISSLKRRILSCGKQTLTGHPWNGIVRLWQKNLFAVQKKEHHDTRWDFYRRF